MMVCIIFLIHTASLVYVRRIVIDSCVLTKNGRTASAVSTRSKWESAFTHGTLCWYIMFVSHRKKVLRFIYYEHP